MWHDDDDVGVVCLRKWGSFIPPKKNNNLVCVAKKWRKKVGPLVHMDEVDEYHVLCTTTKSLSDCCRLFYYSKYHLIRNSLGTSLGGGVDIWAKRPPFVCVVRQARQLVHTFFGLVISATSIACHKKHQKHARSLPYSTTESTWKNYADATIDWSLKQVCAQHSGMLATSL